MNNHQQIVDALISLTDRYGITLIEVPDRLRDKVLTICGKECADELDLLLMPLREQMLRPIRVRAGNKVTEEVVAEACQKIATLEGYDEQLARESINIWLKIFKVKIGKMLYESDTSAQFAEYNNSMDYKTNLSVKSDASVEKVVNQFDDHNFFEEPVIAAYDGKFTDESFEKVADFTISDAESLIIEGVEGFGDPFSFANDETNAQGSTSSAANKSQRVQEKSAKSSANAGLPTSTGDSGNITSGGAGKYTLDDAFKALRNSDADMASKIMMELARAGDSRAQFHLGEFYQLGTGVEQNVEKAKYWYKKAASRGSIPAKNKLLDLENSESGMSCMGFAVIIFLVVAVFKFLSVII